MTPDAMLGALSASLGAWLPGQRWFAGKGRGIDAVRPVWAVTLVDGDPGLVHAVVEVRSAETVDRYQLFVGLRDEMSEYVEVPPIGRVDGRWVFDAVHDSEILGILLDLLVAGESVGGVRFELEPGVELVPGLVARPVGVEQSNTSIVFGQRYILKVFRRITVGPNRDVDLHRALGTVGCAHVAPLLATVHGDLPDGPAVLGMVQRFLPDAVDGWAMASANVRAVLVDPNSVPANDFATEAHELGVAVATVHADLARALGSTRASALDRRALVDGMHRRLTAALSDVADLKPHEPVLRAAFDAVATDPAPLDVQHVHGDLHLGQVLRTPSGWILLDFEGEPAAPTAVRALPRSPLADVAGMLRSFDYAARQYLVQAERQAEAEPNPAKESRAANWIRRNRDAFCTGYAELADDPRAHPALLRALELDKAVYEVAYEHHNRPSWQPIPLAAITQGTTP